MNWRSYIIPVFQALLVHALVVGAFAFNWESDLDRELPPPPQVVQAKVLTMADPIAARKEAERQKEAARKKAEAKRKAEQQRKSEEAKRKAAEKKKAEDQRKAEAQKKADAKRKAEEQKRAEEQRRREKAERQRQEQLAREAEQRERALAEALEDELLAAQEEADLVAAQSYEGLIRQRVMENWHIPLSARNGMVARVRVYLVPTGEITNVSLISGSGDAAFDRSALQAVERTEKIEELQQLEPRVFDKYFRQLTIKFRPEDLDR